MRRRRRSGRRRIKKSKMKSINDEVLTALEMSPDIHRVCPYPPSPLVKLMYESVCPSDNREIRP